MSVEERNEPEDDVHARIANTTTLSSDPLPRPAQGVMDAGQRNVRTPDAQMDVDPPPADRLSNVRSSDGPSIGERVRPDVPPVVAYYRVSTRQQGQSGLGLEAQQAAVEAHVKLTGATLLRAYTEIESGRATARPQLAASLGHCRETGAILTIAKLDRLARNVAFLSALMDGDVEFTALDLPGASRFHLHIMAAVAEQEALAISQRTKAALAAARARGVRLGNHGTMTAATRRASIVARQAAVTRRHALIVPLLRAWCKDRWSVRRIAAELTTMQVALPNGGSHWHPGQVRRVLTLAKVKVLKPRKRRRRTTKRTKTP
jgi:DNA invertase Pin-like site-specific DNA recombinase